MLNQIFEKNLTQYLVEQLNKLPIVANGVTFGDTIENSLALASSAKEKKQILAAADEKLKKEIGKYKGREIFTSNKIADTVSIMVRDEIKKYDFDNDDSIGKYGDKEIITKSASILESIRFCSTLSSYLKETEEELKPINKYLRDKILRGEDISEDFAHFIKVFMKKLPQMLKRKKELQFQYQDTEYLLTSGYANINNTFQNSSDTDKIDSIIDVPSNCGKAIVNDLMRISATGPRKGYYAFPEMDTLTEAIKELNNIEKLLIKDYTPCLSQTLFSSKELEHIREVVYRLNALEYLKRPTDKKRPTDNKDILKSSTQRSKAKTIDHSFKFKQVTVKSEQSNYENQLDELKNLHRSLVDNGFIYPKTTEPNFQRVFSGRKVDPRKRVRWISAVPELKYFINSLYPILDSGSEKWQIAVKCFVNKDGGDFDATQLDKEK